MMTNVNTSRWPHLIWRWCLTCSRPPGISAARRWSWSSSVPWWRWRGEGDVVRAGGWSIAWSCQSSLRRPTDHGVVRLLWALPWSVLSSATTRQPPSLPPSHQILLSGGRYSHYKISMRELENIYTLLVPCSKYLLYSCNLRWLLDEI